MHTIGVCQPAVPLIAAVALMEADGDPARPASMTLMGGPIDTRRSPTAVNLLAEQRGVEWFRDNCLQTVPFPYPGFGRQVYPGFLQLSGFMAMNLDRHVNAHVDMFNHLVRRRRFGREAPRILRRIYGGDGSDRRILHADHRDGVRAPPTAEGRNDAIAAQPVDPKAIRSCALMTVEGEKDDISGVGQTFAAQELCANIPESRKRHYLQKDVGHYGVFNGSKFRSQIAPRIAAFQAEMGG